MYKTLKNDTEEFFYPFNSPKVPQKDILKLTNNYQSKLLFKQLVFVKQKKKSGQSNSFCSENTTAVPNISAAIPK